MELPNSSLTPGYSDLHSLREPEHAHIFFGRRSRGQISLNADQISSSYVTEFDQFSYLQKYRNDGRVVLEDQEPLETYFAERQSNPQSLRFKTVFNYRSTDVDLLFKLDNEVDLFMQKYIDGFLKGLENQGYANRKGVGALLLRLNKRKDSGAPSNWSAADQ